MNTNKILGWTAVHDPKSKRSTDDSEFNKVDKYYATRSAARLYGEGRVVKIKAEKPADKFLVGKVWGVFDKLSKALSDIYTTRAGARFYSRKMVECSSIKPVYLDSSK